LPEQVGVRTSALDGGDGLPGCVEYGQLQPRGRIAARRLEEHGHLLPGCARQGEAVDVTDIVEPLAGDRVAWLDERSDGFGGALHGSKLEAIWTMVGLNPVERVARRPHGDAIVARGRQLESTRRTLFQVAVAHDTSGAGQGLHAKGDRAGG
jgi:hypothetical protein